MLCDCGCGQVTKGRGRFAWGHGGKWTGKPDYVVAERGHGTPCWVWQKSVLRGYGYVSIMRDGVRTRKYAHRIYYEKKYGPMPDGTVTDHLCRVPACVNPEHLEAVPQAVNAQRGATAKITWDDVRAIRASTQTKTELAEEYGVHARHIQAIWSNVQWVDPDFIPRQRKPGRVVGKVYA